MASRVLVAQQSAAKTPGKRDAGLAAPPQPAARQETPQPDFASVPFRFGDVPLFAPGENPTSPRRAAAPFPLPWPIQAKLEVGAVDDPLEREADRVAERVMRMPDPSPVSSSAGGELIQRKCKSCADEEEQLTVRRKCESCSEEEQKKKHDEETHEKLSRKESGGAAAFDGTAAPPIVQEVLRSPGQPLDKATRDFFEPRFGHDFSRVRVHDDARAAESARAVHALAFTERSNVVFGAGQYVPGTLRGHRLLAHELTHVIQQEAAGSATAQVPAQTGTVSFRLTTGAIQRTPGFGHSPHAVSDADARRLEEEEDLEEKKKRDAEEKKKRDAEAAHKNQDRNRHTHGFGHNPHAVSAAAEKQYDARHSEEDEMLDILVPYLKETGNRFLDEWLLQMISAKSDASAKVDDGSEYWAIALIGNLVWAAACFLPGAGVIVGAAKKAWDSPGFKAGMAAIRGGVSDLEGARAVGLGVQQSFQPGMTNLGKTMYAAMTVGGAFAASGLAQRVAADPSGEPTGKDVVADVLNTKRTELGSRLEHSVEWLANDLVEGGFDLKRFRRSGRQDYLAAVDRVLWASLFPDIPVGDLKAIYRGGLNSISGALDEFKEEYEKYKQYLQHCSFRYTSTWDYPLPPGKDPYEKWPDSLKRGEQPLDYCKTVHPFKPKLDFK